MSLCVVTVGSTSKCSLLWTQSDIHIATVWPIAVAALCNLSMRRREQERLVKPAPTIPRKTPTQSKSAASLWR